jgi:hypothetical protein
MRRSTTWLLALAPFLPAVVAGGAAACGGKTASGFSDAGEAATPLAEEAPEDVVSAQDSSVDAEPRIVDEDATDALEEASPPEEAGPCPPPPDDDGSIVPPPRPCDAGMKMPR